MDPATMLQIIGTALSLGDIVVKSIVKLISIKARYQGAPILLSTMIAQLYIVKSALDQLGEFSNSEHSQHPRHQGLFQQVDSSLTSFGCLIFALEERLVQFEITEKTDMRAKERLAFLWSEKNMSEYSMLLDRQVNALTLLLQAMQCLSWPQQFELMRRKENVEILRLAKDCSSSNVTVDDSSVSFVSENTDLISLRFDFDRIILESRIYQQAQRSHLRETIRAGNMLAPVLPVQEQERQKAEDNESALRVDSPQVNTLQLEWNRLLAETEQKYRMQQERLIEEMKISSKDIARSDDILKRLQEENRAEKGEPGAQGVGGAEMTQNKEDLDADLERMHEEKYREHALRKNLKRTSQRKTWLKRVLQVIFQQSTTSLEITNDLTYPSSDQDSVEYTIHHCPISGFFNDFEGNNQNGPHIIDVLLSATLILYDRQGNAEEFS
ncbi:hypothetical protein G7054_g4637 [Neopestalotiopsis clavispora]|nr:hypothetical protein G7054_g4637 [Neopestalotiopsis clavispora]